MKPKYAILVGDGMADYPIPELDGRTPLAYASTPHMDAIAANGRIGLVDTLPSGLPLGSDVANLSLFGYDPVRFYGGRAPIEAASMGLKIDGGDTAFRCNLVTISHNRMADYSAGHIETSIAHRLIAELQDGLVSTGTRLYPGVSYRHLIVIHGFPEGTLCTPPHDITGREITPYLPKGTGAEEILHLMAGARAILADSPVNRGLRESGKTPATDIWLWGQGKSISLPSLQSRFGISGSVISAVDLVRGLGILAGLTARMVEGATGYLGTNYAGKVAAAAAALREEDFVYLHVEAPDEMGHEGSVSKKIQAIEEFDRHVVGPMREIQQSTESLRLLVAPDHATPISLKTHASGPVPFAACGKGVRTNGARVYCEDAAQKLGGEVLDGPALFERFITGTF
jgi:2,3-bisphosphoglycerate-independent phosphoglycerate mutase